MLPKILKDNNIKKYNLNLKQAKQMIGRCFLLFIFAFAAKGVVFQCPTGSFMKNVENCTDPDTLDWMSVFIDFSHYLIGFVGTSSSGNSGMYVGSYTSLDTEHFGVLFFGSGSVEFSQIPGFQSSDFDVRTSPMDVSAGNKISSTSTITEFASQYQWKFINPSEFKLIPDGAARICFGLLRGPNYLQTPPITADRLTASIQGVCSNTPYTAGVSLQCDVCAQCTAPCATCNSLSSTDCIS